MTYNYSESSRLIWEITCEHVAVITMTKSCGQPYRDFRFEAVCIGGYTDPVEPCDSTPPWIAPQYSAFCDFVSEICDRYVAAHCRKCFLVVLFLQ